MLGQQDNDIDKNHLDSYLTPHTKYNSKRVIDLNAKGNTVRLLESPREYLHDLEANKNFLRHKEQKRKGKIYKLEFFQIKIFCSSETRHYKIKKQAHPDRRTSLTVKVQMKTTIRYHFLPTTMTSVTKCEQK